MNSTSRLAVLNVNLTFSSGCFYLLGMWYKRSEAQKRFTFFFASTSLAGAFGGLLASAIGKSELTKAKMPSFACLV